MLTCMYTLKTYRSILSLSITLADLPRFDVISFSTERINRIQENVETHNFASLMPIIRNVVTTGPLHFVEITKNFVPSNIVHFIHI